MVIHYDGVIQLLPPTTERRMRLPSFEFLAAAAIAAALPASSLAQVRASERGTVSQIIDGTTITLDYSRPVARGRILFGGVVPWGHMWTPGANWATTLEADRDIWINSHTVPKGRYSVWMVPTPGEWTVMLSREARVFHTRPPAASSAQARFVVTPERSSHMETLAWYFPLIAPHAATLRMHWGTLVIPLHVTVTPTRPIELTAEERAMYIGSYQLRAQPKGMPEPGALEVFEVGERLRARVAEALFGNDAEFDLVPAGEARFHPGWYRDGKFFDVETDMVFAFAVDGGRATAVEFRGLAEDLVFARGERVK
jgi:hypothetical protein